MKLGVKGHNGTEFERETRREYQCAVVVINFDTDSIFVARWSESYDLARKTANTLNKQSHLFATVETVVKL